MLLPHQLENPRKHLNTLLLSKKGPQGRPVFKHRRNIVNMLLQPQTSQNQKSNKIDTIDMFLKQIKQYGKPGDIEKVIRHLTLDRGFKNNRDTKKLNNYFKLLTKYHNQQSAIKNQKEFINSLKSLFNGKKMEKYGITKQTNLFTKKNNNKFQQIFLGLSNNEIKTLKNIFRTRGITRAELRRKIAKILKSRNTKPPAWNFQN